MKVFFLLLALIITTINAAGVIDYPLPILPKSFSVMVESNFLETNTTVYTFGYYDYERNRFRIEEHSQSSVVVTIVLPSEVFLSLLLILLLLFYYPLLI